MSKVKAKEPTQMTNAERAVRMVEAMATKVPVGYQGYIMKVAPALGGLFNLIDFLSPHVLKAIMFANKVLAVLPYEAMCAITGLMLVLFGGHFPVLIAACEAFYLCGFAQSKDALGHIYEEWYHHRLY